MTPITFAHRGGPDGARENTLTAFRRALDLGASGLESDVRVSGDGEPVLVHGHVIRAGLRRLRVAGTSSEVLAAHGIPRLADLYDGCGSDFELSLDLKVAGAAAPTLDVVRRAGAVRRLWLCSGDPEVLAGVRRLSPEVALVHSMGRRRDGDALEGHAASLAGAGVAALNLREAEWTLGLVTLVQRFGLRAFAWDAQEYRRLRALLQMGIDGLYSDHVERMVAAVGEWSAGDGRAAGER